jgi:hypothetical protein
MHLERPQPRALVKRPTYGTLYERFQLALAAARWDEAENLHFLAIAWLARQQCWSEIWLLPDFASLACVPVPRAVRAALLTAFHRVQLLPQEQRANWQGALAAFAGQLPRPALLLTSRLGLTRGALVQVFAYHAALLALRAASADPAARTCIERPLSLSPPSASASALTLVEENYDLAARYTQQVEDDEARPVLLMQIAPCTLAEETLVRAPAAPFLPCGLPRSLAPGLARAGCSATSKTWLEWFQRVAAA